MKRNTSCRNGGMDAVQGINDRYKPINAVQCVPLRDSVVFILGYRELFQIPISQPFADYYHAVVFLFSIFQYGNCTHGNLVPESIGFTATGNLRFCFGATVMNSNQGLEVSQEK